MLTRAGTLIAVVCCLWNVIDVAPLKLTSLSPAHAHINTSYTNITITCKADGPLSGCQFRWRNEIRKRNGPVLDLGSGLVLEPNRSYLNNDVLWYHYSGEGLEAGECGVTLYIKGVKQYTVGCRVRDERSGWKYEHMTLYAENYSPVPLEVSPPQEVAVGEELSLMCRAEKKLHSCHFHLPGFGQVIMDAGRDSPSPSSHHYYGAGLEQGECGLTLKAKEGMNGVLWCTVYTTRYDLEWRTIPIIVTRPPSSITLEVIANGTADAGLVQASCTVGASRPAANITWYLGEHVLRDDGENDDRNATWTWPYLPQTITQVLNVTLVPGVQQQELRCVATHHALDEPLVASKQIDSMQCKVEEKDSVGFTCKRGEETTDCSGLLEVGETAQMFCKPGYTLKSDPGYDWIQCQQGGHWDKNVLKCIPDCGRPTNTSDETTAQTDGEVGEFPWHVGIYEYSDETMKYACGGSLITTMIVISAAQCFWDPEMSMKKDKAWFRIVAGQKSREWNAEKTELQRRNISDIFFHDKFSGFKTQFMYDIAVVRLDEAFHVTQAVNLVCIDWGYQWEKSQLKDNNTGMVVGPDLTEDGDMTDNLHYINLTFIQKSTCKNHLPRNTSNLLTEDKFCAWSDNQNRSLCPGDIGVGFVFNEPSSNKFYLRGIASVGFSSEKMCSEQFYIGFTSVSTYLDWIESFTD